MTTISRLITADDVVLDLDATDKSSLLQAISGVLAQRCGLDREAVHSALVARERLGSTGLTHGVAVPHARLPGLRAPVAVYARVRQPVGFDAADGRPVEHVVALLLPAHATDKPLQLLASIADCLSRKEFRSRLRRCASAAEAVLLFAECDGTEGRSQRTP